MCAPPQLYRANRQQDSDTRCRKQGERAQPLEAAQSLLGRGRAILLYTAWPSTPPGETLDGPPANTTKTLRRELVYGAPAWLYCSSMAWSRLRFRRMALLPRLLAQFFLEQIAEPGAPLVQFPLRISPLTSPH